MTIWTDLDNLLFEDDDDKSLEEPVFVTEIQDNPSHDNDNSDNEGNPSLVTEAQLTSSESREVESGNERSIVCPICHSLFPLSVIEGHADQCSMWLLDDEEQPCDSQSYGGTSNGVEKTTTGQELTGQQHKAAIHMPAEVWTVTEIFPLRKSAPSLLHSHWVNFP